MKEFVRAKEEHLGLRDYGKRTWKMTWRPGLHWGCLVEAPIIGNREGLCPAVAHIKIMNSILEVLGNTAEFGVEVPTAWN